MSTTTTVTPDVTMTTANDICCDAHQQTSSEHLNSLTEPPVDPDLILLSPVGPESRGPSLDILIFVLSVVCVVGTAGNALVLLVFSRKKDELVSTLFILSLAVVDFVTCLLVVPLTLYMEYVDFHVGARTFATDAFCKFYHFSITSNIPFSALVMVVIAVDRYLCICHPFVRWFSIGRARICVVALGVFVTGLGVCVSLMYGVITPVDADVNGNVNATVNTTANAPVNAPANVTRTFVMDAAVTATVRGPGEAMKLSSVSLRSVGVSVLNVTPSQKVSNNESLEITGLDNHQYGVKESVVRWEENKTEFTSTFVKDDMTTIESGLEQKELGDFLRLNIRGNGLRGGVTKLDGAADSDNVNAVENFKTSVASSSSISSSLSSRESLSLSSPSPSPLLSSSSAIWQTNQSSSTSLSSLSPTFLFSMLLSASPLSSTPSLSLSTSLSSLSLSSSVSKGSWSSQTSGYAVENFMLPEFKSDELITRLTPVRPFSTSDQHIASDIATTSVEYTIENDYNTVSGQRDHQELQTSSVPGHRSSSFVVLNRRRSGEISGNGAERSRASPRILRAHNDVTTSVKTQPISIESDGADNSVGLSTIAAVLSSRNAHEPQCGLTDAILSEEFALLYQKCYTALFLACLVVVIILYVLIYRSVLARRTKRRRQKTSSLTLSVTSKTTLLLSSSSSRTTIKSSSNSRLPSTEEPEQTAGSCSPGVKTAGDVLTSSCQPGDVVTTQALASTPTTNQQPNRTLSSLAKRDRIANLKTAAMLFVVTVVFIVTYLPAFLMALQLIPENIVVFYIYFANNAANPVIYSFMNQKFRDEVTLLFRKQSSTGGMAAAQRRRQTMIV